jgi:hypothetical protein
VAQFERGRVTSCQPRLPETFRSIIPVTGQTSKNTSVKSLISSKSLEAMEPSIIGSEMMSGRDSRAPLAADGKVFPNDPASFPQVDPFQCRIQTSRPTTPYVHHSVWPSAGTPWKSRAPEPVGVQTLESELRGPSESTQPQDDSSTRHSDVYAVQTLFNEVCTCQ